MSLIFFQSLSHFMYTFPLSLPSNFHILRPCFLSPSLLSALCGMMERSPHSVVCGTDSRQMKADQWEIKQTIKVRFVLWFFQLWGSEDRKERRGEGGGDRLRLSPSPSVCLFQKLLSCYSVSVTSSAFIVFYFLITSPPASLSPSFCLTVLPLCMSRYFAHLKFWFFVFNLHFSSISLSISPSDPFVDSLIRPPTRWPHPHVNNKVSCSSTTSMRKSSGRSSMSVW